MMLTTDKRFLLLDDGNWDLRNRHTSDKVVTVEDDEEETELDDSVKSKDEQDDVDFDIEQDEDFDDTDDDLKDLVILDEDELDLDE